MVRTKNLPEKLIEPVTSVHNIVGDLIVHCAATHHRAMAVNKCHTCELAMNRAGEKRPGIHCKECKNEHCHNCAGLTVEQCEMMRSMTKGFWLCKECETKGADLKAVLDSMNSIKTELSTIKEGQAEVVEAVTKRLDRIEDVQEKQEVQLATHEGAIKKNAKKVEEGDGRIKRLEDQVGKMGRDMSDEVARMRQTNAVVKELREIDKCEKNLIFCNIPEPTSESPEDKKKEDKNRLSEIFKEMAMDRIKPANVIRVGRNAHYPRKLKVVFQSQDDCTSILESGQRVKLANGVFISHDRTFNQRQEARLYREEKEREEKEEEARVAAGLSLAGSSGAAGSCAAAPRGRPRGRPRGSGSGSVRGGGRGSRQSNQSRKRQSSGSADRESSRRRVNENTSENQNQSQRRDVRELSNTPEPIRTKTSKQPSTPRPSAANASLAPAGTSSESF